MDLRYSIRASEIDHRRFRVSSPPLHDHRLFRTLTRQNVWKEESLPIRLSPIAATSGVLPFPRVKLSVGWCGDLAGDTEKRAKNVERVEPPIEAESELIEVGLKMLVADAVMDAGQPGLEVGKDEMDDRQILFCRLGIVPLGDGDMLVAVLAETGVAGPIVSGNRGTCGNRTLDEAAERVVTAIGHNRKPNAPSVTTAFALVELCVRFALANLDGTGDQHLVSDAPAFSSRPTTNIAFIDFDVLASLPPIRS